MGIALTALAAAAAQAATVQVKINGTVDYNVIQGGMAGVASGAPVTMTFTVDSNNFLNSANFPTRGYAINLASLDLNVGGVHMGLDNPQSNNANVYFVLRNNDPAVDGFFLSKGVELPTAGDMHVPGLAPTHELEFSVGYSVGTVINSLDILGAVGTYGMANMGSFLWTVGRFGNPGAEFIFDSMTISAVPEPATAALFAMGGLAVWLRRRRAG